MPAGAVEELIARPWRALKAAHFGGKDVPLHASDLRVPTMPQLRALSGFFERHEFGRFAATVTSKTELPEGIVLERILPNALRKRWEELTSRITPPATEVTLLHEASERAVTRLLNANFGPSLFNVNGRSIKVHNGLIPKSAMIPGLEVADFIAQAAGRQAWRNGRGQGGWRRDFQAIFSLQSDVAEFDGHRCCSSDLSAGLAIFRFHPFSFQGP